MKPCSGFITQVQLFHQFVGIKFKPGTIKTTISVWSKVTDLPSDPHFGSLGHAASVAYKHTAQ